MHPLEGLLVSFYYLYPAAVFTYFISASIHAVCTLQSLKAAKENEKEKDKRHFSQSWLLFLVVLTYLAQILAIAGFSVFQGQWIQCADDNLVVGLLACFLVFGLQYASLRDSEQTVWYPYCGAWLLALALEPVVATVSIITSRFAGPQYFAISQVAVISMRYLALLSMVGSHLALRRASKPPPSTDEERQSLLRPAADSTERRGSTDGSEHSQSSYGSTLQDGQDGQEAQGEQQQTTTPEYPWEERERKAREQMEKKLLEEGNWLTYAKRFTIFWPYIWPVNNRSLQLRFVLVGLCLLVENALNLLVPRQIAIILDGLSGAKDNNVWLELGIFAVLKYVSSDAGIELFRQWLWIPVELYAYDAMSTAAYSHILNLSADFHDSKSSSDIMMAIQGGQGISNMVEQFCFFATPMLIDLVVAGVYLSVTFGPYEGIITVTTGTLFLYTATRMISGMKTVRRSQVSACYEEHYVRQAGIQGWQTVTAFNQVGYEDNRYSNAVKNGVSTTQEIYLAWYKSHAFQSFTLLCGLLAGAALAAYQILHGSSSPGQFAMLLMYWAQLTSPLIFFAHLGKNTGNDFIQAERLLDIMLTEPAVLNKKTSRPLKFVDGTIEFDNVCFSYDKKKQILDKISFSATGGTTVAFVGATGAGKSTILKLLNRFYDVTEGAIRIDGQNIQDIDLSSLRDRIGIVPQNAILFDDTIINNIRYARITATDDEVFDACRAACMHDEIMTFTDGYNTRVGERGIKLSGGELQRVAIARAILKRPDLVLLDEATSSVDTDTEQKIQESFGRLCEGRTTFVVAHRLSTIMNADVIMVVENGTLVEQGSHSELIGAKGRYADLWSKQVFVKPKDKGDKPGERALAMIMDDLTPECMASELAKAKSTTETADGNDEDGKGATESGDGAVKSLNGGAMEVADSAEESATISAADSDNSVWGSKLNPGAAEFTPRPVLPSSVPPHTSPVTPVSFVRDASRIPRHGSQIPDGTAATKPVALDPLPNFPGSTSTQRLDWADSEPCEPPKAFPLTRSSYAIMPGSGPNKRELEFRRAVEEAAKRAREEQAVAQSAGPDTVEVVDVDGPTASGGSEAVDKVKALDPSQFRHPRFSRRVHSKSQPSGSASIGSDTPDTELSPAEEESGSASWVKAGPRSPLPMARHTPGMPAPRRVSAPILKSSKEVYFSSKLSDPAQEELPRPPILGSATSAAGDRQQEASSGIENVNPAVQQGSSSKTTNGPVSEQVSSQRHRNRRHRERRGRAQKASRDSSSALDSAEGSSSVVQAARK